MHKSNNLLKTKRMLKPKYEGDRFLHLACQGGNSPLCPTSVTPLAMIYCIYIQLCLLNCTKRAGGVANFMGGPASCLINLCFS